VIDAVLAVEDKRFLDHHGIDYRRIAGAFLANLRALGIREGGSTLTQQLAKNFFLTPERSLRRKAEEAVMALIMEARYEKELILEAYLNEIYLGQRGSTAIHGMGEAARLYFGKDLGDLEIHEAALLAGLIQSPNGHSPHRFPEKALARRDLVLRLMRAQGRLDEATYEREVAQPLQVAAITPEPREGRYFLDALRRQLPEFYAAETLTTDGLRIYSTLDVRLQRAAVKAVREELARLEKGYPRLAPKDGARIQACLLALRPQTGEVVALVGGRDYAKSQYDRCTQARRQVGSVFKPFVYLTALEPMKGGASEITLASWVDDVPLVVEVPGGTWSPKNFDRTFHGHVPVRTALEKSLNAAAAGLAMRVGVERLIAMARRLGIESPLPAVPSLALGSAELTPVELARAYATIANGGVRPHVRTFEDVVDANGAAVEREPIEFQRVLDAGTAYLATSLLEGVVDRGTASGIRRWGLVGPIAGKTGTSNEEKDAWFVGFTPELVAVVWVGYDDPRSLGLAAAAIALPVWARFLKEATGGHVRGAFPRPGEVVSLEIEPETGALALDGCPVHRTEYFLRGSEPATTCPAWDVPPPSIEIEEDGATPRPRERRREPNWIERFFDRWLEGR
jgi:penicillin-binding protein 1B